MGLELASVRSALPVSSPRFSQISECWGFLFYLLFVVTAFGNKRGAARSFPSDMRMAARNACIGLTVGDLFVAPVVEPGLLFCVFAGVACADFEQKEGET